MNMVIAHIWTCAQAHLVLISVRLFVLWRTATNSVTQSGLSHRSVCLLWSYEILRTLVYEVSYKHTYLFRADISDSDTKPHTHFVTQAHYLRGYK